MFTYVFVTLSIIQSQFIDQVFKKAENSEQNVVLLLFLFTLNDVVEDEGGRARGSSGLVVVTNFCSQTTSSVKVFA